MTKTRGRPPKEIPKAPEIQFDEAEYRASVAETRGIAQIKASYTAERDQLNQMIGRVQMGLAQAGLSTAINLQNLKSIKESKSYRLMAGEKGVDRRGVPIPDLGTWDGFCRALGCSPDKIDEDLLNFEAFGADALERLTAVGAGYRELRQFRKLPEDRKLEVLEVAKRGDKEGFAELVEEIITKHAAEKAALKKDLHEANETLIAKDRLLESKSERIDHLEQHVFRTFKPGMEIQAETEKEFVLLKELTQATLELELAMGRVFRVVEEAFQATSRQSIEQMARDAINYLSHCAFELSNNYGIAIDLNERFEPPWMLTKEAIEAFDKRQKQMDSELAPLDTNKEREKKLLAEMHRWDK